MSSGIYQFWKYWLRDRNYIESQRRVESTALPEPLTLSSNVAFVFVILILGLASSVLGFCLEIASYKFNEHDIRRKIKTNWSNIMGWIRLRGSTLLFGLICRCQRVGYIARQAVLFITACHEYLFKWIQTYFIRK